MTPETEILEGYVIDIACVRKNSRDELLEAAKSHTKACALTGHCIESGYGIVTEGDRLALLDPEATRRIVDYIEQTEIERGHRVRVARAERDGAFETVTVEEADGSACP